MTVEEIVKRFQETYHDEYEFDWDDESKLLTLYSLYKKDDDIQWIKADFNGNRIDIYREFLYEDSDTPLAVLDNQMDQILFTESLRQVSNQNPCVEFDDGYGCPFYSEYVGFFNIELSWDQFIEHLNLLIYACCKMNTAAFLDTIDSETYRSLRELENGIIERCKEIDPELCCFHIKDTLLNKNGVHNDTCAYINQNKSVIIGVGREWLSQVCEERNGVFCTYSGFGCFIIRKDAPDEKCFIFDKRLIIKVEELFFRVEEDSFSDPTIQFSLDSDSRAIMKCGNLWAVICGIHQSQYEKMLTDEKNTLKQLEQDFIRVAPRGLWSRTYDFSSLDDRKFENMCRDLIVAIQFTDVRMRGNTRAADGGVDITATEEYDTLLGKEQRKWIFQCKHTQGQINRKDLSEVRDLLTEFDADCYGLFYSGTFTPKTIDRIKTIRERDGTTIKAWDRNDLEILLGKFPTISVKYFGL